MRMIGLAAVGVVLLGSAGAQAGDGVTGTDVRRAIFPRSGTRDLGVRDEVGRPLYLDSFAWGRWPQGPAGTYVALVVAATERGVVTPRSCERSQPPVPGGVLLAVVRRETVRVGRGRARHRQTRLVVVAQDAWPVTLGCHDRSAIAAILLDLEPYRLRDGESGVLLRQQTVTDGLRRREVLRLYRYAKELQLVLETEHPLRDWEHRYEVTLAPATTTTRGYYDLVRRVQARPLPGAATQPATRPATQPAVPARTIFRWNGRRFVP